MELVVTKITPEYREAKTKQQVFHVLDQYRLDYILHIPGKTEIFGQHVVDDTGPLDLGKVQEAIIQNLKSAFAS